MPQIWKISRHERVVLEKTNQLGDALCYVRDCRNVLGGYVLL